MKIIIVGGGKSGFALASALSDEGHDVTIVDNSDEVVSYISNALDVICVQGSGTDSDVLKDAGVENADLLIATMRSDETNMICGIAARRLGTKHVIARVSATQYLKQNEFLRETLGLSVVVNPEYECAKEISRIIKFPSASHVSTFSKCQLEIAEYRIAAGSPLIGLQLKDLPRFGSKVLISVVERGNEALQDVRRKGIEEVEVGVGREVDVEHASLQHVEVGVACGPRPGSGRKIGVKLDASGLAGESPVQEVGHHTAGSASHVKQMRLVGKVEVRKELLKDKVGARRGVVRALYGKARLAIAGKADPTD